MGMVQNNLEYEGCDCTLWQDIGEEIIAKQNHIKLLYRELQDLKEREFFAWQHIKVHLN